MNLSAGLQYDNGRYYDAGLGLYTQPGEFTGTPSIGSGRANIPFSDSHPYATVAAMGGSIGPADIAGSLLQNSLVTFGLNKSLISTGLKKPLPEGLFRYRLTKGLASTLTRIPTDLTLNIGREVVADFRTVGTVVGVPLESADEIGGLVFQFSRGRLTTERLILDKPGFEMRIKSF